MAQRQTANECALVYKRALIYDSENTVKSNKSTNTRTHKHKHTQHRVKFWKLFGFEMFPSRHMFYFRALFVAHIFESFGVFLFHLRSVFVSATAFSRYSVFVCFFICLFAENVKCANAKNVVAMKLNFCLILNFDVTVLFDCIICARSCTRALPCHSIPFLTTR